MKATVVQKPVLYSLVSLLFLFGFYYQSIFDTKIDLNGDNIAYYALGKSIASDKGYVNFYDADQKPANHFPPGYPYLIGYFMKMVSEDVNSIKILNGVLFGLSLVGLLFIFYNLSSNIYLSFLTCIAVFLNGHLIRSSFIMMSEIPFLFLSTVSVFFFLRTCRNSKNKIGFNFLITLLACVAAYYTRSIGIALGFGFGVAFLVQKRWLQAVLFGGGFFMLILPWYLRSERLGGNSYVDNLLAKNPYRPELGSMGWDDWLPRLWENILRYISVELPNGLFTFLPVFRNEIPWTAWLIGLVIVGLMIFGLTSLKQNRGFLISYIGATFFIVLLWPPTWYGPRFIIAVIPFFIFLTFLGIQNVLFRIKIRMNWQGSVSVKWLIPICTVGLFLLYKPEWESSTKRTELGYPAVYQQYFDLAQWTAKNVKEGAVISVRKPGLFSFFYGGFAVRYIDTFNADSLVNDLKMKKVDYVVLDQLGYSSTARYLWPAIQKNQDHFQVVAQAPNSQTYLLRFTP